MLPVVGSLSDVHGRRPLLLLLPFVALCLRITAVVSPTAPVLVMSRMFMGAIVSGEQARNRKDRAGTGWLAV